jgi:hypothetical protein
MLPARLRIKAKTSYEIVTQDVIKDDLTCMGLCDDKTKHIYIKNGLSQTDLMKTLIHETIHCWEFEYKIKLSHENVYKLEEAIFKFLTLNKLI